jgi:hypothetical protein
MSRSLASPLGLTVNKETPAEAECVFFDIHATEPGGFHLGSPQAKITHVPGNAHHRRQVPHASCSSPRSGHLLEERLAFPCLATWWKKNLGTGSHDRLPTPREKAGPVSLLFCFLPSFSSFYLLFALLLFSWPVTLPFCFLPLLFLLFPFICPSSLFLGCLFAVRLVLQRNLACNGILAIQVTVRRAAGKDALSVWCDAVDRRPDEVAMTCAAPSHLVCLASSKEKESMRGLVVLMVLVSSQDGVVWYSAVVDKHRMSLMAMVVLTLLHQDVWDDLPIQRSRHIGIQPGLEEPCNIICVELKDNSHGGSQRDVSRH